MKSNPARTAAQVLFNVAALVFFALFGLFGNIFVAVAVCSVMGLGFLIWSRGSETSRPAVVLGWVAFLLPLVTLACVYAYIFSSGGNFSA